MKQEHVQAFFALANIEVKNFHRLENCYWPDVEDYAQRRRDNPWWLVQTEMGMIKIGHRKNVTSVDWSDLPEKYHIVVTEDDVTKDATMVHAWTYPKLLGYLMVLGAHFRKVNKS